MSDSLIMTSGRQVGNDMVALGIGVALLGIGIAALLAQPSRRPLSNISGRLPLQHAVGRAVALDVGSAASPRITAARRLNRAAGMLAFSVLADSAIEHYRALFFNPAMYIPLAASAAALAVSARGVADRRESAHFLRDLAFSAAAATGLVGTGFHVYNVASRPGRISWENLFHGAPLGAPSAILLSGLLGFMAERVRSSKGRQLRFLGFPAGRLTAAITAGGLLGTAAEAGLLHFRGAYHNPFMFVPVTVPPAAAIVMTEMAVGHPPENAHSRAGCSD